MTIKTTRRRVLSGVAGGAVALTGAAVGAQADEDVMTPQEEWDVCIQGAVTLMRRAGNLLKQYPDRVRDPLAEIRGAA